MGVSLFGISLPDNTTSGLSHHGDSPNSSRGNPASNDEGVPGGSILSRYAAAAAAAVRITSPVSLARLPPPGVAAIRVIVTDDASPMPLFSEQELLEGPLDQLTGTPRSIVSNTPHLISPKLWSDYPVKPTLVAPIIHDEDIPMKELGEQTERLVVQTLPHPPPTLSVSLNAAPVVSNEPSSNDEGRLVIVSIPSGNPETSVKPTAAVQPEDRKSVV